MDQPKWGTCEICRWNTGRPASPGIVCNRLPTFMQIHTPSTDTCGEWEPVAGRVCGTCWRFDGHADTDGVTGVCRTLLQRDGQDDVRSHKDTCPAWCWTGPQEDE